MTSTNDLLYAPIGPDLDRYLLLKAGKSAISNRIYPYDVLKTTVDLINKNAQTVWVYVEDNKVNALVGTATVWMSPQGIMAKIMIDDVQPHAANARRYAVDGHIFPTGTGPVDAAQVVSDYRLLSVTIAPK